MVHKITVECNQILEISEDLLGHKSASPARQVLLSPFGKRILVSMLDIDELWDLESKSVVACIAASDAGCERTWTDHPSQSDRLLLATGGLVKIFAWDTLTELSESWSVIRTSSLCPHVYPV